MRSLTTDRSDQPCGVPGAKWRGLRYLLLAGVLLGISAVGAHSSSSGPPISLTFVGDVMMGRGVAPVVVADGSGVFEEVRLILRSSDLTLGNLESPLTAEQHQTPNPHALEADPVNAVLLAGAGFDVLSLANNHLGDVGPNGVLDTIRSAHAAGLMTVGAGIDLAGARLPLLVDVGGVRVAVLAFDATGAGLAAGTGPGVVPWDGMAAKEAVRNASARSDLLVVSLHGGVEYLPESDPRMLAMAEELSGWGADVVWGHGPHVVQPVMASSVVRSSVLATSLGNFIFDQRGPLTGKGAILQVLADRSGVIAYRIGSTSHADLRVRWVGWELPEGDAVLIQGEWWNLIREVRPLSNPDASTTDFEWGTVISASTGRITGSDHLETVISFRQIPGAHPVRDGLPQVQWLDAQGMSPHLGIYRADDLTPIWVAGMVPAPVAGVAACDGALALAYSHLDDPSVVATGGAVWRPFGLDGADRLPGPGRPVCADIDGDGSSEPVILDRG